MPPLRLGLIGANPDRGWALSAHLPALRALGGDDFALQAVSTRRMETASRAAKLFGAPSAYDDYRKLLADPAVDAVAVTVRLAHHHDIVRDALRAGKHVYCEWPLAQTTAQAEALVMEAEKAGRHVMVGLQARASPVLARLKALLDSGYVGRLHAVSVVASGFGWGDAIDADQTYLFDKTSGATMLSITGGHLLDAIQWVCGDIAAASAVLATRQQRVAVLPLDQVARRRKHEAVIAFDERTAADGPSVIVAKESFTPTAPDQVVIAGLLASGAPISVHIRGGMLRASGLLIEISGEAGELRLTAPAGVIQMMPLSLFGARGTERALAPIEVETGEASAIAALSPVAANVARLYAAFARDIRSGAQTVPDFSLAVRRHRFLDTVAMAAENGSRLALPNIDS